MLSSRVTVHLREILLFQPTDTLCSLYASHQKEGKVNDGIDVTTGTIIDAVQKKIYDVYSGKALALKLATNVAATILKVDQVCALIHIDIILIKLCRS
jgi:chaperonin GroEL (HSP60 family)